MGLTAQQRALITKARTGGGSDLAVSLDDAVCCYLLATIVKDLNLEEEFRDIPLNVAPFFGSKSFQNLKLAGVAFESFFERLIAIKTDVDTYFFCLATLHKARLKYERILQSQAIPTVDQVGPRGLLQYGTLSPSALIALLFWRKWMYDIDNRSAQETGYVFEPIIAYAIGGVPYSAKKSPIKRGGQGTAGRQVDCIINKKAYEFKIRVTIAASGQGRWGEELEFPRDCQSSGYTPILVVLDPTPNMKLEELSRAFISVGGSAYIGEQAWKHLSEIAGPTMFRFLELYVHDPLSTLVKESPEQLPSLTLRIESGKIVMEVGKEYIYIQRNTPEEIPSTEDGLPEDIEESGPTPASV
ncbi:restriction endonuclease [Candidatus Oscillochloris fontis]|uniref:restriction endonuclease n=1 Tax=Candidatus Oscillochloris fontis TaxID=2496868 RepID=UPI00101C1AAD|nr:restriction endonuclease [Candidatus Oscillochloris fontis]